MNREEMLKILPQNSVCAEIGVCEGKFSQLILKHNNPKKLFLVDIWGHIALSYIDDNMISNQGHESRFRSVAKNFIEQDNVYLIRSSSNAMADIFPPSFFDWIYVDADHSYEGCKSDLILSNSLVKESGYICGHDYSRTFPGVIQAVDEFVKENNYILTLITSGDKHASYLISKTVDSDLKIKEKFNG